MSYTSFYSEDQSSRLTAVPYICMLPELANPALYLEAAERVRKRQLRTRDARPLVPGGPHLAPMDAQLNELARRLANEVSTTYYAFSPVVERRARIAGKERVLQRATPLDDIVLGALARALGQRLEPGLSSRVFSYRRGRSARQALYELRAYLRRHARERPDPRARGLYVLRRDVQGYGDAIPSGADSQLWPQLAAALARAGVEPSARLLGWLRVAFRPPLARGQWLEEPDLGVPTGSPLQPLACNLYLSPLDALCEAEPEGFYARYGDDILFAHPCADVTQRMAASMDARLAELRLASSAQKSGSYYFTAPGRPSPVPGFRGISSLDYLGVRVDFRGAFGMKRDRQRALLRDLRARLIGSRRLLHDLRAEQRARALAEVINAALRPDHPVAGPAAAFVRATLDDRAQLRAIDQLLVRALARSLSGDASVRALRRYPPRRLRAEAGLASLVRQKNRAQKAAS